MSELPSLYGGITHRRVTPRDLQRAKDRGERWPMLTSYDAITAGLFDEAGIPVLLVGDSAANVVLGYETTVRVSTEELLPMVQAVVRSTSRALVVADLPFGTYQASPQQALETAVRFLRDGGAQAVKLEGGVRVAPQVELLVQSGVAVVGHVGLTPQSELVSGRRVQGRGDGAQALLDDALAVQEAGAFAVVLEAVPADLAARVTKELHRPHGRHRRRRRLRRAGAGLDRHGGLHARRPADLRQAVRRPARRALPGGAGLRRRRARGPLPRARSTPSTSAGASASTTTGPVPRRTMTTSARSSVGLVSRWTVCAGMWTKSPGSPCTTPAAVSTRNAPRTTYATVSWSPCVCQPLVAPGSVCTRPDQTSGSTTACQRCIPGVGWPGTSSSRPTLVTGVSSTAAA